MHRKQELTLPIYDDILGLMDGSLPVDVPMPSAAQIAAAQARGVVEIEGAPAYGSGQWAIVVTLYEVRTN